MEDIQPNERRLSRKGSTTIPRVRAVHTHHRPRGLAKHYLQARNTTSDVKAREPAQSNVPRPGRFSHMVGHNSRSSSSYPTTIKVKAQTVNTSTVPCRPPPTYPATSPESIIDLTLDPPSPSASASFRWSTFRSGQIDVRLRCPSNNSSSQSSIQRESSQVSNKRGNMSVPNGDDMLHLAQPPIHTNVLAPVRPAEDSWITNRSPDQLPRPDALAVVPSSNCSTVLDDDTRLFPDCSPGARSLVFACDNLPLSLGSYDKPRRILRSEDSAYVITAHGVIDQVRMANVLQLEHHIRAPQLPLEESVDDACILSHQGASIIVLGHTRERNQLSLLDLGHSQAPRHIILHRGCNTARRPGVSAVATLMSPLKFASGGHDHRVHLWDVASDLSGASAVELSIKHTSVVHSLLAIVDSSHKLVSVGADREVPIYDMSAERVARTLKMSVTPHHAHGANSPFCTLFEVAHLDTQFEVRDHRYPHRVVQRFGFTTGERRGRYEKADTWSHFVACGDKNGTLHVWDLRNVTKEVALRPCFNAPIVQVVHTGQRLLVCSKRNELACIDFSLGL